MARQLEHFPNLVTMFLTRAREKGDAPFLWAKHGGTWHPTSWRDAAGQVATFAESLTRIGLEPGDRVMLVSENRPEWLIADLGDHGRGLRHGPDLHDQHHARSHAHPRQQRRAKAVIVSTQKLAKKLIPAVLFSSECQHVIGIEDIRTGQSPARSTSTIGTRWSRARPTSAALEQRMAAVAARTSPASSTPAAPAARRAA